MTMSSRLTNATTLGLWMQLGLLLEDGHFDYGNGFHGTSYLNPHPLLDSPSEVLRLSHELVQKIEVAQPHVLDQIQAVMGPVTGGALLAFAISGILDGRRDRGHRSHIHFAPVHNTGKPEPGGGVQERLILRPHYAKLLAGQFGKPGLNVYLVDDVVNTGKTMRRMKKLAEDCGAKVIGTASLWNRKAALVDLPGHVSYEECDTDPQLVAAEECYQCRHKVPFTAF